MSPGSFVRPSRWLRYWWPLLALGVAMLVFVAFVGLGAWIQITAREMGTAAKKQFGGDRVEALIGFVQSDRHSLTERNRAVWALGQLRDPRALPVLQKYYTGQPCDHAKYLCQEELKKAIALVKGDHFDPLGWLIPQAVRQ